MASGIRRSVTGTSRAGAFTSSWEGVEKRSSYQRALPTFDLTAALGETVVGCGANRWQHSQLVRGYESSVEPKVSSRRSTPSWNLHRTASSSRRLQRRLS